MSCLSCRIQSLSSKPSYKNSSSYLDISFKLLEPTFSKLTYQINYREKPFYMTHTSSTNYLHTFCHENHLMKHYMANYLISEISEPLDFLAYATNVNPHKTKLDARAFKFIFLGFATIYKTSKLYNLDNHSMWISRDVQFCEENLPYQKIANSKLSRRPLIPLLIFLNDPSPPNTLHTIYTHAYSSTNRYQWAKHFWSRSKEEHKDSSKASLITRLYGKHPKWLLSFHFNNLFFWSLTYVICCTFLINQRTYFLCWG